MRRPVVVAEWVGLVTLGTALGVIAAVELLAIALWRFFGVPGLPAPIGVVMVMFFAGAAHGATVGIAQSLLLRKVVHGIHVWSWTLATAAGAGLAWAVGMAANIAAADAAWTPEKIAFAIGIGGTVLGALLGSVQWLLLRRHAEGAWTWIPANAAAWVAGLAAMWALVTRIPDDVRLEELLQYAIGAGLATGLAIGAITAVALILVSPRRHLAA